MVNEPKKYMSFFCLKPQPSELSSKERHHLIRLCPSIYPTRQGHGQQTRGEATQDMSWARSQAANYKPSDLMISIYPQITLGFSTNNEHHSDPTDDKGQLLWNAGKKNFIQTSGQHNPLKCKLSWKKREKNAINSRLYLTFAKWCFRVSLGIWLFRLA